jgi:hypothetical protein
MYRLMTVPDHMLKGNRGCLVEKDKYISGKFIVFDNLSSCCGFFQNDACFLNYICCCPLCPMHEQYCQSNCECTFLGAKVKDTLDSTLKVNTATETVPPPVPQPIDSTTVAASAK